MYVVIEDGSRQFRVQEGEIVKIDFRKLEIGASFEFDRVLLSENDGVATIGQPVIAGARVVGEVVDLPRVKTYIQRYRRRKNYRRFKGHTQPFTSVRVKEIVFVGANNKFSQRSLRGAMSVSRSAGNSQEHCRL